MDRVKLIGKRMSARYKPRKDLTLGDAVAELKYLVDQVNVFAIVSPSSKDVSLLKEIIAVVDGMDVPEIVGGNDGEA
tara:strand:- start:2078 stop:2308 length:231 start_codon:yes stop_codon:yes gene_type:complete